MEFSDEKYNKTGWKAKIGNFEFDDFKDRLIINVATGRKYWPLFSDIINIKLGKEDPALLKLEKQLYFYTHPMIDRLISELETMLSDIYREEIKLKNPRK